MSDTEKTPKLDPVAQDMLDILAATGRNLTIEQCAKLVAEKRVKPSDGPNAWRRYMTAVRQQALHLARSGRIDILRRNQPIDPADMKGVVKLRVKAD
ncbi:MAG: DUF3253 domain-containing protein [Rhodobacterales bacterium]|nr:DUF3253 domain-containing protein [Rhodobacterales bacterium]